MRIPFSVDDHIALIVSACRDALVQDGNHGDLPFGRFRIPDGDPVILSSGRRKGQRPQIAAEIHKSAPDRTLLQNRLHRLVDRPALGDSAQIDRETRHIKANRFQAIVELDFIPSANFFRLGDLFGRGKRFPCAAEPPDLHQRTDRRIERPVGNPVIASALLQDLPELRRTAERPLRRRCVELSQLAFRIKIVAEFHNLLHCRPRGPESPFDLAGIRIDQRNGRAGAHDGEGERILPVPGRRFEIPDSSENNAGDHGP